MSSKLRDFVCVMFTDNKLSTVEIVSSKWKTNENSYRLFALPNALPLYYQLELNGISSIYPSKSQFQENG